MKKLVFAWMILVFGFVVFWVLNINHHDVGMLPLAISMYILAVCLAAECEYVERVQGLRRAEKGIIDFVNKNLSQYPFEFVIEYRKI